MRVLIVMLAILAWAGVCEGRIINVDDNGPADFNNIQAAIDDSNDGDTVEVQPGTYTGSGNRNIDFLGRAITVTSINPADANTVAQTVIDCNSQGPGFYFHNNEDSNSVLNGLTVTNATRSGIMCLSASPTILNCIVIKNVGPGGGGIYTYDSSPIIVNCTLAANQSADEGGAISCTGGAPSLTGCLLVGNSSSSSWGGGINSRADKIVITNCRIVGNSGNGVSCEIGRTHLINCVIVGNRARYRGAGILCIGNWEPEVTITNCIIRNNRSPSGDQIALTGWMNMLGEHFIPELSVSYCNVQGGAEAIEYRDILHDLQGVHWGQGNIDADPCFADAGFWDPNGTPEDANDDFWVNDQGDYHLKSQAGRWDTNEGQWTIDEVTSFCIDAGSPMSPIGPEPFPNGGIINMGAYGRTDEASKSYFGKAPCETIVAGDINGDCVVDFRDFVIMGLHWCEHADGGPTVKAQIGECTGRSDEKAGVKAEPSRFSVEVRGSYIHFEDVIAGNCCPDKIEVEMTLAGSVISIFEDEYLSNPCRCTCSYPTTAVLGPFEGGTYRLRVYKREIVDGQVQSAVVVGSVDITIGGG